MVLPLFFWGASVEYSEAFLICDSCRVAFGKTWSVDRVKYPTEARGVGAGAVVADDVCALGHVEEREERAPVVFIVVSGDLGCDDGLNVCVEEVDHGREVTLLHNELHHLLGYEADGQVERRGA